MFSSVFLSYEPQNEQKQTVTRNLPDILAYETIQINVNVQNLTCYCHGINNTTSELFNLRFTMPLSPLVQSFKSSIVSLQL